MSRIALNHGSYMNLLSLQQVTRGLNNTQQILSTGKKVNSAIDNPSSYYTARALSNRASDLSVLLDSMSQKIQTIKAASEGIAAATSYLEQMSSVAEQALENPTNHRDNDNLIAEGYTLITSEMTAGEISSLINSGAKVALASDINIDDTITITASNVEFNGNNYTINFSGSGSALTSTKAAIEVTGASASADFKNINIKASGDWAVGISSRNGANVTIDNTYGIKMTGNNSYRISNRDELLYAGRYNTETIVKEIGTDGLAAKACSEFYAPGVDKNDATFGQGQWYLASFGELLDVYGYDKSQIPAGSSAEERTMGAIGDNKTAINAALKTLKNKGVAANELTNSWYWSSSEKYSSDRADSWALDMNTGGRYGSGKNYNRYVRSFQLLENCFDPLTLSDAGNGGGPGSVAAPKIGDVMYADKTWGSAGEYSSTSGKTVIGVVVGLSDDARDVTIMSLKNLTFSNQDSVGNFKPENPYNETYSTVHWATEDKKTTNIEAIKNYNYAAASSAFQSEGTITVSNTFDKGVYVAETYAKQYTNLVSQYDKVVTDSNYNGVNLLKGDSMEVVFNEERTNKLTVQGQDVSSSAIGLNQATWKTIEDVAKSIKEIKVAIATLRSVASDLGNNNSIIQTRQDFTEKLINTLEEGADKLTLADMNEASADMLALQTRQSLAINALSLATMSEQAVLMVF